MNRDTHSEAFLSLFHPTHCTLLLQAPSYCYFPFSFLTLQVDIFYQVSHKISAYIPCLSHCSYIPALSNLIHYITLTKPTDKYKSHSSPLCIIHPSYIPSSLKPHFTTLTTLIDLYK